MTAADTVESQAARVEAAKEAGHVRVEIRELGYPRDVCKTCRCNWPCPDMAEAREWRPDALTDEEGEHVAGIARSYAAEIEDQDGGPS